MRKKTIRIMVMGSGGAAGINFIECLRMSKTDYHIVGCDINKWHLELPQIDTAYIVPHALDSKYIDIINEIIEREKIEFIHAQPDIEVEILSENREYLKTKYLLPDKHTVRICRDKMMTHDVLSKNNVPVPISQRISNVEKLKFLIEEIKQRTGSNRVWIRAIKGAGSKAALPVRSFRQAKEWIHYWRNTKLLETKDFMISEYLPGREFAFQSLWYNGELLFSQARERLEYLMGNLFPSGQSSTPSVAVTVHDERINEIATKAVLAIDPKATGIFCLDIKENIKGIPCITEINCGRFFTTSNFFAHAGCNMPDYYVKLGVFGRGIIKETKPFNAIKEGLYWIRSVDLVPKMINGNKWRAKIL